MVNWFKFKFFKDKGLLFKQVFKSVFNQKLQFIALLVLATFLTLLVTGLWTSVQRLDDEAKAMGLQDTSFNYGYKYADSSVTSYWPAYFSLNEKNINYTNKDGKTQTKSGIFLQLTDENQDLKTAPAGLINRDFFSPDNLSLLFDKNNLIQIGLKSVTIDPITNKQAPFFTYDHSSSGNNSLYGTLYQRYDETHDNEYLAAANRLLQVTLLNYIETSDEGSHYLSTYGANLFSLVTDTIYQLVKMENPSQGSWAKQFKDDFGNIDPKHPDYTDLKKHICDFITNESGIDAKELNLNYDDDTPPDFDNASQETVFKLTLTEGLNRYLFFPVYWNKTPTSWDDFNFSNFSFTPYNNDLVDNNINKDPVDKLSNNSNQLSYTFNANFIENVHYCIGKLTNFQMIFRRAFVYFDYSKNLKYRVVNLGDPKGYNAIDHLNILEGNKSWPAGAAANNVMINPQYARHYKLKIGQKIAIGDGEFVLAAVGGDPWLMYPTVNDDDIFPNTRQEMIVYVGNSTFNETDSFVAPGDRSYDYRLFLKHQGSAAQLAADTSQFKRWLMFSNTDTDLQQYVKQIKHPQVKGQNISKFGFQDRSELSGETRRTTTYGMAHTALIVVAAVSIFVIGMLVGLTIVMIIRGAVKRNASQLGVLKALGYRDDQIMRSYWAYAVMTVLIAVPIGWIVGLVLQIPITEIFNTIFIMPYQRFDLLGWPLLACAGGLLILISAITTCSSLYYLASPPLAMITPRENTKLSYTTLRILNRIQPKSFWLRMQISLFSASWPKILGMGFTIFIATFVISVALLLPTTINSLNDSIYGNLNAANVVQFKGSIYNMPFSRYQIIPWKGVFYDTSSMPDEFERDAYPVGNNSPLANWVKVNGKWINYLDVIKKGKDPEERQYAKNLLVTMLAENFYTPEGKAISPGWIDAVQNLVKNDKQWSKSLGILVCNVVSTVIGAKVPHGTTDWSTCVTAAFEQKLPSYVKSMMDRSPETKKRFAITYNTVNFNPDRDELITMFESGLTKTSIAVGNNSLPLVQTYGVSPKTKMYKFSDAERSALSQSWADLNQHVKNNTLEIPVVLNAPTASNYGLDIGSTFGFYPQEKVLKYQTNVKNEYQVVPRSAWQWNNQPQALKANHLKTAANDDIFNLNFSKTNYHFDNDGSWSNPVFGYQEGNAIKPYYNLNDIKLNLDNVSTSQAGLVNPFTFIDQKTYANNTKAIQWLTNRPLTPYSKAYYESGIKIDDVINEKANLDGYKKQVQSLISSIPTAYAPDEISDQVHNFKYKVVGIYQAYDSSTMYINQEVANKLLHYSTAIDKNTGQYMWFNGRLTTNTEITDITTRVNSTVDHGDFTLDGLKSGAVSPGSDVIDSIVLKKEMINKLVDITSSITTILIVVALVCAIVVVLMIVDLFINQFSSLIAKMRMDGYYKREVNGSVFGVMIPGIILGYATGFGIAWLLARIAFWAVAKYGGTALPLFFNWWLIPVTAGIIIVICLLFFLFSTRWQGNMDRLRQIAFGH